LVPKNAAVPFGSGKLPENKLFCPLFVQGSMFMMVRVDMSRFAQFKSDMEFVEGLVSEQSVFCLPGKCFNYPNSIRLVLTVPMDLLEEACHRISNFCQTHGKG
jgi:tyrosine aminotransferase